ncbi:MAG TPA: PorP/SprF family type IX secretion system membrane protein [Sediminibacterium sp.]|nr:PorP/SprF family type IX secretion system membrane protein [Sediminibacterium sp.]
MMQQQHIRFIRVILALMLISFLHQGVIAQDPQFSQFFSSPLTLNPALTGNFNGTMRAVANIRSQNADYANAYNTKTASVDFHLFGKQIKQNDQLSMGVLLLSDQTGNRIITQNNLGLSLAYMKGLDEEQKRSVTLGFQVNYGNKRFNAANAQFEDQLTPGGFTNPSGDMLLSKNLTRSAVDVNAGMLYQYTPTTENHYYIGVSLFNILGSQKGFGDNVTIAGLRKSIHGGMYSPMGYNGTLHASFHLQQQKNFNQMLIGGAYSHFIKDALRSYVELYFGAWYRTDQTLIPYIGVEWNYWRLGYTNDISFSRQITAGQLRHSNEISLYYPLNKDKSLLKYKCGIF